MSRNFESWQIFITHIDSFKDQPLDTEYISQHLKTGKLKAMNFKEIDLYFRSTFRERTLQPHRQKWHNDDKYLLIWVVTKYCQLHSIDFLQLQKYGAFKELAQIIGLDQDILLQKWLSVLNTPVQLNPWTPEEDQLLIELKKGNSRPKWTELTLQFVKSSGKMRFQKQIRERWNTTIDPSKRRDAFTDEEALELMNLAHQYNKSWSVIARQLSDRTENAVKNQYKKTINEVMKKMNLNKDDEQLILSTIIDSKTIKTDILEIQISNQKKKIKQLSDQESQQSTQKNQCYSINPLSFYPYCYCPQLWFPYPIVNYIHYVNNLEG